MWEPKSWDDIEAILGRRGESADLDFKRELPKHAGDFGKQIAAMSRNGGVILYGVDEDKARRVAARITPVPVDGVEERIRNATGAVEPRIEFSLDILRRSPGDRSGVVVVRVPESPDWPHMVDSRFPVRDGTTTRYLSYAELRVLLERADGSSIPAPAPLERVADLFDQMVVQLPASRRFGLARRFMATGSFASQRGRRSTGFSTRQLRGFRNHWPRHCDERPSVRNDGWIPVGNHERCPALTTGIQ
jgi:hypothetical protein